MSTTRWLLVVSLVFLVSCKSKHEDTASRDPGPDMIREALKKSKAFDHVVDLAPAPLTARIDASWSCGPREKYEGEGVVCVRSPWRVTWNLTRESSVKPDAELIDAERAAAWNAGASTLRDVVLARLSSVK